MSSSFLLTCSSSSSRDFSLCTTSALFNATLVEAARGSMRLRSHGSKSPLRLSCAHRAPASLPSFPSIGTTAKFLYSPPSDRLETYGFMLINALPRPPSFRERLRSTGTMTPWRLISLKAIRPSDTVPIMHASQSKRSHVVRTSVRRISCSSNMEVRFRDERLSRCICLPRRESNRCVCRLSAWSRKAVMPLDMSLATLVNSPISSGSKEFGSELNRVRTPTVLPC